MGQIASVAATVTDGDGIPLKQNRDCGLNSGLVESKEFFDVNMVASKERIIGDIDVAVDKLASNILDEHCMASYR